MLLQEHNKNTWPLLPKCLSLLNQCSQLVILAIVAEAFGLYLPSMLFMLQESCKAVSAVGSFAPTKHMSNEKTLVDWGI